MQPKHLFFLTSFLLFSHLGHTQSLSEMDMDEYFSELQLSEEQKPQFDAISQEYYSKLEQAQAEESSNVKLYKAYKKHKKARDKKMKALLNDEQFQLYRIKQKELEDQARRENR